jgi:nucleoside-diphosphate-sugar epimerase
VELVAGRVAITGATGFIGRRLAAFLIERRFHVRAVVRPNTTSSQPRASEVVRAPLVASALIEAFRGVDTVIHLAGVVAAVRERDYVEVNVAGTRAVAEAAAASGAHLIHVSSLTASGPGSSNTPRQEDSEPKPITPYGRSKLESERVVRSIAGLQWTILRPAAVYGPGDRAMLPLFQMADRGMIPAVGRFDAAYTFVHVDDVVRSIEAAIRCEPIGETIFVGHPELVTVTNLLDGLQGAVGRSATVIRIPAIVTRLAALGGEIAGRVVGRPMPLNEARHRELSADGFVCCVDRLRERLGVVAKVNLRRGLKETAAWYRANGWLA